MATVTPLQLRSRLLRANQQALRASLGSCQRLLDGKLVIHEARAESETIDACRAIADVAKDAIDALEASSNVATRKKRA